MPAGAIYVGRPTKWGNLWCPLSPREVSYVVHQYRQWLAGEQVGALKQPSAELLASIAKLRGHDLVCWCPLDQPCHADVLLELANA